MHALLISISLICLFLLLVYSSQATRTQSHHFRVRVYERTQGNDGACTFVMRKVIFSTPFSVCSTRHCGNAKQNVMLDANTVVPCKRIKMIPQVAVPVTLGTANSVDMLQRKEPTFKLSMNLERIQQERNRRNPLISAPGSFNIMANMPAADFNFAALNTSELIGSSLPNPPHATIPTVATPPAIPTLNPPLSSTSTANPISTPASASADALGNADLLDWIDIPVAIDD